MAIDVLMGMRVFTRVVELKSFAKAADKLDFSRGMASRYVAQLEEHLGVRLINRTTRHLSLTEAGLSYYQKAIQILALVAETEQAAAKDLTEARGTLRITSSLAFGGTFLGEVISAYLSQHPQVNIETLLCERMVDLIDEGFDLAIRVAGNIAPGLIARPLTSVQFVVCAAPEYLYRYGKPAEPADLLRHNCLIFDDSDLNREWHFKRNGNSSVIKVRGNFQGNNGNILCNAAASGLGIIYQPAFLVQEHLVRGKLVRLFPEWETDILKAYAVYPHRKYLLPKVRTFIDFIVMYFGSEPFMASN